MLDVRSVDASKVGLTAGSAANLIAVDAQRLMDTAGSLHELWGLPLQVLAVLLVCFFASIRHSV